MRTSNRVLVVVSILAVIGCCALFALLFIVSKPERLGCAPGSVKLRRARLDGKPVLVVEGQNANYVGQVHGIGITWDGNKVYLEQYVVRWHPFSRLTTHAEWPLLIPLTGLSPDTYEVFYWNRWQGYLSVGRFDVSAKDSASEWRAGLKAARARGRQAE